MRPAPSALLWASGLWLLLVAVSLATRDFLPLDETRYLAVAWEMWQRGDFLVPRLNGEAYHHKPPLLFWLIHLGWAVFGVNEWWPRLVAPLFGLGSLFLTFRLARQLWPDAAETARLAPLIVLGSLLWTLFTTLVMFDMLLACFTLLGLSGVAHAWRHGGWRGWLLLGLALGLGVLSKGPVVLLHVLPAALLAPWWFGPGARPRWGLWYLRLGGAVLLGAGIALLWAVPAGLRGGEEFREAIFFGQTAGRMVQSFAHRHPFWWYVPLLPVLLFPWLLWPRLWRAFAAAPAWLADPGARFCLAWSVPVFLAFSLISGKQVHYLLPLFPSFALLAAYALAESRHLPAWRWELLPPGLGLIGVGGALLALAFSPALAARLAPWAEPLPPWPGLAVLGLGGWLAAQAPRPPWPQTGLLALSSAALVLGLHLGLVQSAAPGLDLHALSRKLHAWQQAGVPLAHFGKYHGQYQFLGRLERPLDHLPPEPSAARAWFEAHPQGKLLSYTIHPELRQGTLYSQPYRGGYALIWEREGFLDAPYWRQLDASAEPADDEE